MSFAFRDYYQQLGVSRTASQSEIRAAFRRLARQYHPDVAVDKKEAEDKFKEINEAYEVLGDPERRRKFDAYHARGWFQQSPPPAAAAAEKPPSARAASPEPEPSEWEAQAFAKAAGVAPEAASEDYEVEGTGFSDFFERLFGVRRQKATPRAARRGFTAGWGRGQDIEADFLVKLEEVIHGATRRISFRRGKDGKTETYLVKIPKGVTEGQRIRLAGIGEKGRGGGQPGDLYLRVKLQKHPDFRVDGYDLVTEVELPIYRLVLGTEIDVPTLEGKAKVKIPPGSKPGQVLRLPGLGLPNTQLKRGHLLVYLQTAATRYISPEEQRLWETIAQMQQKA